MDIESPTPVFSPMRVLVSPTPSLPSVTEPSLMLPPPAAVYNSQDELYQSIQAWAAQHNYAFRVGRSKLIGTSLRKKINYNCDRCGQPPAENNSDKHLEARKRQTKSRKTGCQFSINAIELNDSRWEVRVRDQAQYNTHNHLPSYAASSHPVHRKLAQEDINKAKQLHSAGIYLYALFTSYSNNSRNQATGHDCFFTAKYIGFISN
jgi:hypothetical protein